MTPKKCVVIIDDSLGSRATLGQALMRLGFEVVGEGSSGSEAIRLAQALKPDVLFLAVDLPDLDGPTTATQILEIYALPIIGLSSHLNPEVIQRAKEASVMAYLVKPLREEELLPAIEPAISRFEEFNALRKETADLEADPWRPEANRTRKGDPHGTEEDLEPQAFGRIQKASMHSRRSMAEIAQAILLNEAVAARTH